MNRWSLPDQAKGKFNETIRGLERRIEGRENTCMFVIGENGELCGQSAVRWHSIPRASVLARLRDKDATVLEFLWGMTSWRDIWSRSNSVDLESSRGFEPRRTGIYKASVAHFACELHDKTFAPIDVAQHDSLDGQVPFLAAYRTALFVNDRWRKYGVFLYELAKTVVGEQENTQIQKEWRKLVKNQKKANNVLTKQADKLGRIWYSGQSSHRGIETCLLRFRSKLRFAASVMMGTTSPYVTVWPEEGDAHSMIIAYHRSDRSSARRHVKYLKELADTSKKEDGYGVEVIGELLAHGFGSIVASPSSYQSLALEKQDIMRSRIHKLSQADLLQRIFQSRELPVGKESSS